MKKPTTLEIGTISHGTLRPEDLLDAMLSALEPLRLTREDRSTVRAIDARLGAFDEDQLAEYYNDDESAEDLQALIDLADSYAPPLCYVGMHVGDGSDLGVWPCDLDDLDTSEIYKSPHVPQTGAPHISKRAPYWLHVNDHGNASLYVLSGNRYRYAWGIV